VGIRLNEFDKKLAFGRIEPDEAVDGGQTVRKVLEVYHFEIHNIEKVLNILNSF
jgi:hypothetical protein